MTGSAPKDLDNHTREGQGLAKGVVGLIYEAENIALENGSLAEVIGGGHRPFIKLDKAGAFPGLGGVLTLTKSRTQPFDGLALIELAMEVQSVARHGADSCHAPSRVLGVTNPGYGARRGRMRRSMDGGPGCAR